MKARRTVLLLTFLLVAAGAAAGAADFRETVGEGLICAGYVGMGRWRRPGTVVPIVLVFENRGEDRIVTVETEGTVDTRAAFALPGFRTSKQCLYLPVTGAGDLCWSLRIKGGEGEAWKEIDVHRQVARLRPTGSSGAQTKLAVSLAERGSYAVHPRLDAGLRLEVEEAELQELPTKWIGFTTVDLIILDGSVWRSESFPRDAVIDWMCMGGTCLLVDVPPDERSAVASELAERSAFFRNNLAEQGSCLTGLGGVAFVDKGVLADSHPGFFRRRGLESIWRRQFRAGGGARVPPIHGVGELPFWPILIFLVVFSVAAGPLGWYYLVNRKGWGLLYYAAAPTVSLCAIVLMVSASLFHEGLVPRLSCGAVKMLDQRVKISLEFAQFGIYAPFRAGEPLSGRPGELPHFLSGPDSRRRASRRRRQRWTLLFLPDRWVYDGALPSRSRAWFGRRELRRERRRLVVWQAEGRLFVENHLGRPLEDLLVTQGDAYAHFESLPAGARADAPPLKKDAVRAILRKHRGALRRLRGLRTLRRSGMGGVGWDDAWESGDNAYVARFADGVSDEDVWLDSYRASGTTAMILGVF